MDLFTNLLDTHAKVMKAEQSLSIETFSDAVRSMHTLTQSKAIPELRLTFNDTDTEGLFFGFAVESLSICYFTLDSGLD